MTTLKRKGWPILLSDTLLKGAKDITVGTRLAGTMISRKMVVAISTGVLKPNDDPGVYVCTVKHQKWTHELRFFKGLHIKILWAYIWRGLFWG